MGHRRRLRKGNLLGRLMARHLPGWTVLVWVPGMLAVLAGQSVWSDPAGRLRRSLSELFEKNVQLQHAICGVHVESLEHGDILFTLNNHKLLVPASNMKILIAAAILDRLGPGFRFQTQLLAGGPIKQGVLHGPLVVRGGGDPSIGGRFHRGDRLFTLRNWAQELRRKGINRIEGDLIGDDDLFDDEPYGQGWQWDDLPYWYAAEVGALSFNDNCIDLIIKPGPKLGSPAAIIVAPDTDYVRIINKTVTVENLPQEEADKEISFTRSDNCRVITVEGPVLFRSRSFEEWAAICNPTLYTVSVFKEVLQREGIEVTGRAIDIDDLDQPLHEHSLRLLIVSTSPPLSELLEVLLGRSQNLYGEMFLKYLGARFHGRGSGKAGAQVIGSVLEGWGIPNQEYVIADGSGLSRENLVSPAAICGVLRAVARKPYAEVFKESLPVAGKRGTLAGRMKEPVTRSRVWAKTGSIRGVQSLSGYILSRDDELFVFSFIINNHHSPAQVALDVQDRACRLIAGFSRR